MDVTREWLASQVEQGEPSTDGTWYAVSLDQLKRQGFEYLEVHYNGDDDVPNVIMLTEEG